MAPAMSNQGIYNAFLVAALLLGLFYPVPAIANAFTVYGLGCIAVAELEHATVMVRILYIQTIPAVVALIVFYLAQ